MEEEASGDLTSLRVTTGERIRLRREARGLTRVVLAGLVGRSPDWLKKIERGEREITSLPLLIELARNLDIKDVAELIGCDLEVSTEPIGQEIHHVVPRVRSAMREVAFDVYSDPVIRRPQSAGELNGHIRRLWLQWHTAAMQRSEVGIALPALIRDAHVAIRLADGAERRACRAAAADLYRLVQRLLAHICEPELHALAVERGRALSEEADTPLSLANAAWASSVGLCASGHFGDAAELARRATVRLLNSTQGSPNADVMGTVGALQLESAAAHGLAGREGDAFHYLDAAADTASCMPPGSWHLASAFNKTNVEILAVIVDVSLHRNGEALALTRRIQLDKIPSVVRRSRLLLEAAQAHANRREQSDAVHTLNAAMTASPEAVALIPWARTLADELADNAPRTVKPLATKVMARMKAVV